MKPSHRSGNIERLKQAKDANRVQIDYTQQIQKDTIKNEIETSLANGDSQIGIVGCVVVDSNGNLAPATSTGGLVNKMAGRIGDTPIIGAGRYANEFCAVSATGIGEAIIRATVVRDVAAIMEFKGLSLKEAADCVVHECTLKGVAGLVVVSASGEVVMSYNTTDLIFCDTKFSSNETTKRCEK